MSLSARQPLKLVRLPITPLPQIWWGVEESNLLPASERRVTACSGHQCRSHPKNKNGGFSAALVLPDLVVFTRPTPRTTRGR